jgi:hypothetical protein
MMMGTGRTMRALEIQPRHNQAVVPGSLTLRGHWQILGGNRFGADRDGRRGAMRFIPGAARSGALHLVVCFADPAAGKVQLWVGY